MAASLPLLSDCLLDKVKVLSGERLRLMYIMINYDGMAWYRETTEPIPLVCVSSHTDSI